MAEIIANLVFVLKGKIKSIFKGNKGNSKSLIPYEGEFVWFKNIYTKMFEQTFISDGKQQIAYMQFH